METRNKGLIVLGIVSLAIGIVVSFYHVTELVGSPPFLVEWETVYPFLGAGITLLVAGIFFMTLGFILPQKTMQKILPPPPPPS
jgi:hypothetical protein